MADFIGAADLDAAREIAARNLVEVIARLVQRTQHGAIDEQPAAHGQHQRDRQQHDGHGARDAVVGLCLDHKFVGAFVHELQHAVDGFAEGGVGRAARVVQIQVLLNGHGRQRGRLALVDVVELPVGGFQLFHQRFRTGHARRLAEGIQRLAAFLHEGFGPLGLRRGLFGLALLHVHQRRGKQQPAPQEGHVGAIELRRLIGVGVVHALQLFIAGVQTHPRHAIGYEHGAREEQQHQNDTGANFQITKHEISERTLSSVKQHFLPYTQPRTPRLLPAASANAQLAAPRGTRS
ncbi:hypothetical protein D3C85_954650 [compost metagenome]